MGKSQDVSWERTQEQINEYLAGRMDDAARESFELRMFAEPELSAEVERAVELRAAFRDQAAAGPKRPMPWIPLAAAAALVVVAVGLWVDVPQVEMPTPGDSSDALRGDSNKFELAVVSDGGALTINWPSIPEATNYEVRVYLEDGSVVYEQQLPGQANRHEFTLDDRPAGRKLLRVRALDSFRDVRADSGLIPVPED